MLAITVGFPLGGKSTHCKKLKEEGFVVVCPDTIRRAIHGEQFIPLTESFVWTTAEYMVRTLLLEGHNVVVDATNTTFYARSQWVRMAKQFDTKLSIVWIQTSPETCLERNKEINRLPEEVIERMVKQFQVPTEEEGIIHIIREGE